MQFHVFKRSSPDGAKFMKRCKTTNMARSLIKSNARDNGYTTSVTQDCLANFFAGVDQFLLEDMWASIGRPYYNIFPVAIQIAEKLDLAKLKRSDGTPFGFKDILLPWSPMVLRFAVGASNVFAAIVHTQEQPDGQNDRVARASSYASVRLIDKAGNHTTKRYKTELPILRDALNRSYAHNILGVTQRKEGDFAEKPTELDIAINGVFRLGTGCGSIVEQLEELHENLDSSNAGNLAASGDFQMTIKRSREQLIKLLALISLIADGEDFVTPALLDIGNAGSMSAEAAARQVLERRATAKEGIGFDVGRTLQERIDREGKSPHWRMPHPALFHTGEGRKIPVIKLRRGSLIGATSIHEIPTGFEGEEQPLQPKSYRPSISNRLRFLVMKRDGNKCRICGRASEHGVTLEVDHVIPVAKGGSSEMDNLQALCNICNNGKWKFDS